MQEEQDPSPKYIKGFNAGYNLQKEDPELLDLIISKDAEFIEAAEAGKRQLEIELNPELAKEKSPEKQAPSYPEWLSDDRIDDLDKGIDLGKDKDIEPEI